MSDHYMKKGQLYIVATPIGNLADITFRAVAILREVAVIAAEDTRQSRKLLVHYGITTPLISVHAHNERQQSLKILQRLQAGEDVAYITDAGTPLISDPGLCLVKTAQKNAVTVVPIPGACAAIAALSACGLPGQRFFFEGFMPVKSGDRRRRLKELHPYPHTLIFYEAPHRILGALSDMVAVFDNRYAVIARELTKKFETIRGGELPELYQWLRQNPEQRLGEFVIVVGGNEVREEISEETLLRLLQILLEELSIKQAVSLATKITGEHKNKVYQLALVIKNRFNAGG
jgi:16S rRNA (cytidine1402-2'-O)-methyltransferase